MKFSRVIIFGCFFFGCFTNIALSETLYDYLFTPGQYPESISDSVRLADKEKDRVSTLIQEVDGAVLFLPINSAWEHKPGALEALLHEPEGNTRYDMLLAASTEVPIEDSSSWAALKQHADQNGGVIDSAYGSPYFVNSEGRVCVADWSNGQYIEGECANVVGSPVKLSDATVYQVSKILLPSILEDAVDSLIQRLRL